MSENRREWIEEQVERYWDKPLTRSDIDTLLREAMAMADADLTNNPHSSAAQAVIERWLIAFAQGEAKDGDCKSIMERYMDEVRRQAQADATPLAPQGGVREALELILPLAKGYAAEHPVGSNQAYVEQAQAALTAHAPSAPVLIDEVMTVRYDTFGRKLVQIMFNDNANEGDRVHVVVTGPVEGEYGKKD